MNRLAEVLTCGAEIDGVAAAYDLSKAGINNIRILHERPGHRVL